MLHIAQLSFSQPIMDSLKSSGERLDPLFSRCGLADFKLDSLTNYVPLTSLCAFFNTVNHMYGGNGLLDHYHEAMTLDLVPDFTEIVEEAPDFLTVCQAAAAHDNIVFSNEQAVFRINGPRTTFGSSFTGNELLGHKQLEALNLSLITNAFRHFLGTDWDPLEVHVQQPDLPGIEQLLHHPGRVNVVFNQPYSGVIFSSELLITKNKHHIKRTVRENRSNGSRTSLTTRLIHLLDSNNRALIPNLEQMAILADVSGRTLQRELAAEGTTYSGIVEHWRLLNAIDLLTSTTIPITEIAQRLGYSDVANFNRAFTRWCNCSPGRYRDSQSH